GAPQWGQWANDGIGCSPDRARTKRRASPYKRRSPACGRGGLPHAGPAGSTGPGGSGPAQGPFEAAVPIAETAGLDLVHAAVFHDLDDRPLDLDVVLLAAERLLGAGEDHVELFLIDPAVVAHGSLDVVLDLLQHRALEHVAGGLADLGQRLAGRVNV